METVFKFPKTLLAPYLQNEFLTESLADFYLAEMKTYAPELHQIQLSEQILTRRIKSDKRQFFLPKLVGFASANDIFVLEGLKINPQLQVPPPPQNLTWNAGIGLQLPISDNRKRKTNLEQSKLDKELLQFSKQEVENALEKNIRSQVQQFKVSYQSFAFAEKAAVSANG